DSITRIDTSFDGGPHDGTRYVELSGGGMITWKVWNVALSALGGVAAPMHAPLGSTGVGPMGMAQAEYTPWGGPTGRGPCPPPGGAAYPTPFVSSARSDTPATPPRERTATRTRSPGPSGRHRISAPSPSTSPSASQRVENGTPKLGLGPVASAAGA